jgi:hypothetical protein
MRTEVKENVSEARRNLKLLRSRRSFFFRHDPFWGRAVCWLEPDLGTESDTQVMVGPTLEVGFIADINA